MVDCKYGHLYSFFVDIYIAFFNMDIYIAFFNMDIYIAFYGHLYSFFKFGHLYSFFKKMHNYLKINGKTFGSLRRVCSVVCGDFVRLFVAILFGCL